MAAWSATEAFAPHQELAADLLPHAFAGDPSHDVSHLARVWANARAILAEEPGDDEMVAVGCMLHDCVHVEKNSPDRPRASRMAAERAIVLMAPRWSASRVAALAHAIEAHSFSARVEPLTHEARILQDADRLDSLGAIGVARTFHVAGRIGRPLYDPADPRAERRELDDVAWSLDHFRTKLLGLAGGFRTRTGARMAEARHERLVRFLAEFEEEAGLEPGPEPLPAP